MVEQVQGPKLEEMMRNRNPAKEDRLHLLSALAMCENVDWNGKTAQGVGSLEDGRGYHCGLFSR